jgi:hypothetical protein
MCCKHAQRAAPSGGAGDDIQVREWSHYRAPPIDPPFLRGPLTAGPLS